MWKSDACENTQSNATGNVHISPHGHRSHLCISTDAHAKKWNKGKRRWNFWPIYLVSVHVPFKCFISPALTPMYLKSIFTSSLLQQNVRKKKKTYSRSMKIDNKLRLLLKKIEGRTNAQNCWNHTDASPWR